MEKEIWKQVTGFENYNELEAIVKYYKNKK